MTRTRWKVSKYQSPSVVYSHPVKRTAEGEEGAVPLEHSRAAAYRALSARANYLALDRTDIAFAAKECCRRMSEPTSVDWQALVRIVRYLSGVPRLVCAYPWQDPVVELSTWVVTTLRVV